MRFPVLSDLRPTPGRLRETLFNWLGESIAGADCLDLCAGSGALGLEALSRGAASVEFVERDRRACSALQASMAALDGSAIGLSSVWRMDVRRFLEYSQRRAHRWDIIFLDPPFAGAMHDDLLPLALACLRGQDSRLCLEMPSKRKPGKGHWRLLRKAEAGDTALWLLALADTDTIAAPWQEECAK